MGLTSLISAGAGVLGTGFAKVRKTLSSATVKTTSQLTGQGLPKIVSGGSTVSAKVADLGSKAVTGAGKIGGKIIKGTAIAGGTILAGAWTYDYVQDVRAKTPELRQAELEQAIQAKGVDIQKEQNSNYKDALDQGTLQYMLEAEKNKSAYQQAQVEADKLKSSVKIGALGAVAVAGVIGGVYLLSKRKKK